MTSSNPHPDTNTATSQPPEISQAAQPVGNKSRLIWQKCFYCSQTGSYKQFRYFLSALSSLLE